MKSCIEKCRKNIISEHKKKLLKIGSLIIHQIQKWSFLATEQFLCKSDHFPETIVKGKGRGRRWYMVKFVILIYMKLPTSLDSTLFTELKNINFSQNSAQSKLVWFRYL